MAKGSISIWEDMTSWLASSNTLNPLHNLAVVSVRLGEAIAKSLNSQKIVVEDVSNQINAISELNTLLLKYKSKLTDDKEAPLGKSVEEAESILKQLRAQGLTDLGEPDAAFKPGIKPSTIDVWESKLNANKDSLNNLSSQETLKLQTFTSRYGQANDQASSVIQKDAQGKNTLIGNLRGN